MAGLPQHHLIIVVPPLGVSADDTDEEKGILKAHGVTVADIEPAVLALARRQGADGLRRAARLAATNRALREHGFAQLLLLSEDDDAGKRREGPLLLSDTMRILVADERLPLCADELAGMAAVGLSEEEYRAIKGVEGIVMGLHLDAKARQRVTSICKRQKGEPKKKIAEKIRRYARQRLQPGSNKQEKLKRTKKRDLTSTPQPCI